MRRLSRIGFGVGIGLLALTLLYTASAHMGGYGPMMGWSYGIDEDENPHPQSSPELPEGPALPFWMYGSYRQPYGYGYHCPMMGW